MSRMIPVCDDTLFGTLEEPMRSIGYRVYVLHQKPDYVAEKTGMSPKSVDSIADDALAEAMKLMIKYQLQHVNSRSPDLVREHSPSYKVD